MWRRVLQFDVCILFRVLIKSFDKEVFYNKLGQIKADMALKIIVIFLL